jgi:hypothetical protein
MMVRGTAQTPAEVRACRDPVRLRRLGRTLAESRAVPLTIQHTLIDRAQADLILKTLRKEPFNKPNKQKENTS